jgi:hypothetical protein
VGSFSALRILRPQKKGKKLRCGFHRYMIVGQVYEN